MDDAEVVQRLKQVFPDAEDLRYAGRERARAEARLAQLKQQAVEIQTAAQAEIDKIQGELG